MNITPMKTRVKTRSSSEVRPCPVRKPSDRLQFAHARDGLARRARFEIGERQAEEMMEKPPPQLDVDAVGGVAQRIGAQELEDRLEQAQRHHADDQHHQGRHALVDEHFVDDELEEERARKREQLHEERGDQHMRERPAVAQDRGPEPAKAEAVGIRSRPAEPPGDENDGARRESFGFVERHLLRRARDGVDEADPALVGGGRQDGRTRRL